MANVTKNLFDYINSKDIAAYVTEKPENQIPYFAETLFPAKKQLGTDISWLKGANGLPVAIQPSEYDVKARLREKTGFEGVATEMAFFRESTRIGEKDRQQLNLLLNNPESQMAMPIIRNIFDEVARLVEGVRVQGEYMRCQLLTGGKIDVASADGRVKYVYDYGQQNLFKCKKGHAAWGEANEAADPVRDINAWCDYMEVLRGIRPTRLVMNRNTFLDMIHSPKVHKMMYPDDSALNYYVTDAKAKSFIEEATGCAIFIYAKKITTLSHDTGIATGDVVNLIPDGKVVILPPRASLGSTWYGTTPEESDLMTGSDAQVSIVNNGTAITTYKETHPVQVVTVVSSVMIPSFETIDDCAVADVTQVSTDSRTEIK